ncbi:MAG: copper oxidase, partial [Acidobacteria bacterium]|nr:copper oxidase [Acidobacteriota bacterium]
MSDRRGFFSQMFSAGAGLLAGRAALGAQEHQHPAPAAATGASGPAVLVETPDLPKLPYQLVDGFKEFHLMAEPVKTEFLPGKVVDAWGFNGSSPGPTIEVNEGDRVRVLFHNHLPEMTTVHWHGLEVPINMDGVPGISQDPVLPGGMFTYEFTVNQNGTFFYHSHFAMQEMLGMIGLFIIHPKTPHTPKADRDFGVILQEWAVLPNNTVPNTLSMEFNWLTLNGKAGPAATPMLVKHGERVRIRMVNLGMDHHPMHIHGNQFVVTGTEGGRIPQPAWYPGNTVLVGVAQARDIEFDAKYVGDWMLHCHLPHHMMNQMVSMVGPMSHGGAGAHTGLGMREGMGIVRQANALEESLGPGLGRGLGVAADRERPATPAVGPAGPAGPAPQQAPPQAGHEGHDMSKMSSANAQDVPGYPQDMWMPMDQLVAGKPEVDGLPKDWTGAMMGMMTLVRVLPPDRFDE